MGLVLLAAEDKVTKTGCDETPLKVATIWYEPLTNQVGVVLLGLVSTQLQTKGGTAVTNPVELTVMVFGGASRAAPVSSVPVGVTVKVAPLTGWLVPVL